MQQSPDLTRRLQHADLVLAAFVKEPTAASAASDAVAHFADLTRSPGEALGPAQAQQASVELLAHLALWSDARASGGTLLLQTLVEDNEERTAPAVESGAGPAGQLAALLLTLAQKYPVGVMELIHRAWDRYAQVVAQERDHGRQRAGSGESDPSTPVRYYLTVPLAERPSRSVITSFPTATVAWLHFLRRDEPRKTVGIAAEPAGAAEELVLRPADLHSFASREAAEQGEAWGDLRSGLERQAEVEWLKRRMTQAPRYFDDQHPLESTRVLNQWTSAVLEATVRLGHTGVLQRMPESLVEADLSQVGAAGRPWSDSMPEPVAAAVAAARLTPRQLDQLGTGELAAHWRALRPFASRIPDDDPELADAVSRMLTELTARDIEAQRLRAVLEPLQADAWMEEDLFGPFDGSPALDEWRQQHADHAQRAAQAYTAARVLHEPGSLEPGLVAVRGRALREAGINTAVGIATGTLAKPAPSAVQAEPDRFLSDWIARHPAAGPALAKEQLSATLAVLSPAGESASPRAAAQAVYWQLRADRTAAAYSVLARLTQTPSAGPAGPYEAALRELTDEATRAMVPVVFGSGQRAAQLIEASAGYAEQLIADTGSRLAVFDEAWLDEDVSSEQVVDAESRNQERTHQVSDLRRAGRELLRLFPELTSPAPGIEVDPASIERAAAQLASGADTRREIREHRAVVPSAHDQAQQAARTAPLQSPGGPARA